MSENGSRKLVVEICNAKNLMPKDGQGTSSPYVLVDFDGQRRRTKTKLRDLNPQWEEKLEFLVNDPESMPSETLELNVYNDKKNGKRTTFLGKVKISGNSFPKIGSESLVYYPLEKRSVFSQIKGEIGLKVYYLDEEPSAAGAAAPENPSTENPSSGETPAKPAEEAEKKEEKPEDQPAKEEEKPPENANPAKEGETKEENAKKEEAPASAPVEEKQPVAEAEKSKQEKEVPAKSEIQVSDSGVNELQIRSLGDRTGSTYDLVERMPYLFVRVLKAKHTGADKDKDTVLDTSIYAKLAIGTHSIRTRTVKNTDWDQVYAFHKERLNSTALEVSLWVEKPKEEGAETAKDTADTCLGNVPFDLQEVPKRVPPDSPLAPQWYTLEGSPGTDVMLAVWFGTQADEAFQEAWQSDSGGLLVHTRGKVYLSPKLWYLRLTVIQTQDLQLGSGTEGKARTSAELYVKGQLGAQVFKTAKIVGFSASASSTPSWNEDLVFVAAEPFEPFLTVSVEDQSSGQMVGHVKIQVSSMDKRTDYRTEPRSRWFNLCADENRPYVGRIHVRVCLEGGYHVLDEAAHVTSDVRSSAKQLWKPPIGSLEVGILGATNLLPVKTKDGTRGTADVYCVAKYGRKWVRTRTILDRFNPRWNEQYTWDVYDPCTVLTVGVFDNSRYRDDGKHKDARIGKIRIRLSTLDVNRIYTNSYSLTVLHPSGAKKMGELELAVRFSCSSWINLLQAYTSPMLPRMHYAKPLGPAQQDLLRHTAMRIVATRLARSEPPLGHEVVQYLLDTDTHMWSMRRCKANWFRIVGCLTRVAALVRWFDGIRTWVHPSTTVLVHVLFTILVICPHLILPTTFLYLFIIGIWRYRFRHRIPANMDPRLSHVDAVGSDELDEEFDGFPTTRAAEQVRARYDRLRSLAGRVQTLLGDVAAQGERVEALLNWRDPRATGIFVAFCLLASSVFYLVPFQALLLCFGFYSLRHPRFRDDMPPVPVNFFRRLPSLSDRVL